MLDLIYSLPTRTVKWNALGKYNDVKDVDQKILIL